MRAPSAGEIAEVALACTDRSTFRAEVSARLRRWIGGDGGWFHTVDPSLPLASGAWADLDLGHVERARRGWLAYAVELAPLLHAAASRGAATTTEIFGARDRDRLSFFREIARPLGIERSLWIGLAGRGHLASLGVSRTHGDFRRAPLDHVRELIPVLTLADRSYDAAPRTRAIVELAAISPRERQIVEILVLGYTNAEIALALGVSVNTVRKQLASIFRKLGASTRAELVGLALRGG